MSPAQGNRARTPRTPPGRARDRRRSICAVGRLRLARGRPLCTTACGHRVKRDIRAAAPSQSMPEQAEADGRWPSASGPAPRKNRLTHRRSPPTTQRSDWPPSADKTPAADARRPAARGRHRSSLSCVLSAYSAPHCAHISLHGCRYSSGICFQSALAADSRLTTQAGWS